MFKNRIADVARWSVLVPVPTCKERTVHDVTGRAVEEGTDVKGKPL